MRIAIIRQRYNPFGGAERFVERAVSALRARSASVTIVTRSWSEGAGEGILRCDPFYFGSLWRDASFARAACRALAQDGFDLVQSHERVACCDVFRAGDGVHAEWLAQRARALGVLGKLRLRINPYHAYTVAAERRLFASPHLRAVICNSHMVREEIRRWYGVAEDMLHVIYNGVDTARFGPRVRTHRADLRARFGLSEHAFVLLFVGSGFERKGLAAAIHALRRSGTGGKLLVVGHDKHAARYRRLAAAAGLAGDVIFTGPQREIDAYYGGADAFVLPTLYDPFPNAALEAMACGLPVLTTDKCGVAEIVARGGAGRVCDALDVEGLAEGMRAFAEPEQRADAGAAAREAARPLDIQAMTDRLLSLYGLLLDSAGPRVGHRPAP